MTVWQPIACTQDHVQCPNSIAVKGKAIALRIREEYDMGNSI